MAVGSLACRVVGAHEVWLQWWLAGYDKLRTTAAREAALRTANLFDECDFQKLCDSRDIAVARRLCNATECDCLKVLRLAKSHRPIVSEAYITGKETDISAREDVPGAKQV